MRGFKPRKIIECLIKNLQAEVWAVESQRIVASKIRMEVPKRKCFRDGTKKKRSMNGNEIARRKRLVQRCGGAGSRSLRRLRAHIEADSPQTGARCNQDGEEQEEDEHSIDSEEDRFPMPPPLPQTPEIESMCGGGSGKKKKQRTPTSDSSMDLVMLLLEDEDNHKEEITRILYDWYVRQLAGSYNTPLLIS